MAGAHCIHSGMDVALRSDLRPPREEETGVLALEGFTQHSFLGRRWARGSLA